MKKNRGITLIALVITIIVLLILAGVTIVTLTGDNGLLRQADKAKMLTEIGEIEEKVKLKTLENENQQLIEGSLDGIGLDISENLINKYKDILYVKDSKLYLSFIASFPQTVSYINNKEKIEALKDKLEITYDSIKAYNKVTNPYFDDGLKNYSLKNSNGNVTEVRNENDNNYLHIEVYQNPGGPQYVLQIFSAASQYNQKIYVNIKYRNEYVASEENYIVGNPFCVMRSGNGYERVTLSKQSYINSYRKGWIQHSGIKPVEEHHGTKDLEVWFGTNSSPSTRNEYTIDFDDVYAINLTEIFGAGNEPTKEQMDEIFNNF